MGSFSNLDAKIPICRQIRAPIKRLYSVIPSRTRATERETAHTTDGEVETQNTLILWRDTTMMKFIKNFRKDENGAVTVDYVVLTAAVIGMAVAAYSSIQGGATTLTSDTATFLDTQTPLDTAD
jgi:Flp pilus assembly pilin Flp